MAEIILKNCQNLEKMAKILRKEPKFRKNGKNVDKNDLQIEHN